MPSHTNIMAGNVYEELVLVTRTRSWETNIRKSKSMFTCELAEDKLKTIQ